MFVSSRVLLAATAAATLGLSAHAASISWSSAADNSAVLPTDNGNVLEAVNAGGAAITVNGISFLEGDAGAGIVHSDITTALSNSPSGAGAPAGASVNFATVLDSHRWMTGGGGSVATLTLSGLTVGTEYTIQMSMSDARGFALTRDYVYGDTDGGTASASFTRGDNVSLTGTFTADAATQAVTITTGASSSDPGLSYYVLSHDGTHVPEPGSLALLGLGGLLIARRRRG